MLRNEYEELGRARDGSDFAWKWMHLMTDDIRGRS